LYFTSHDNLLFYVAPAKAIPPPPPKAHQMPDPDAPVEDTEEMPLIWAITPYRLNDGKIQWLEEAKSEREAQWYDEKAQIESERSIRMVHPFQQS
jgi:hypothetical protein